MQKISVFHIEDNTNVPIALREDKSYKYGFNGMERDDAVACSGNHYTTFHRPYDPRLGRWWKRDPLAQEFPWQSAYVGMDNNPIWLSDPFGDSTEKNINISHEIKRFTQKMAIKLNNAIDEFLDNGEKEFQQNQLENEKFERANKMNKSHQEASKTRDATGTENTLLNMNQAMIRFLASVFGNSAAEPTNPNKVRQTKVDALDVKTSNRSVENNNKPQLKLKKDTLVRFGLFKVDSNTLKSDTFQIIESTIDVNSGNITNSRLLQKKDLKKKK